MFSHTLRRRFAAVAARVVIVAALLACVTEGASAQALVGPLPYLGLSDSPFDTLHPSFVVETLEDGQFNMPGVSFAPSAAVVLAPGGNTDSVDADDGAVNGSGTAGRCLFVNPGAQGLSFTFNPAITGALPTFVGVVCTDGAGSTVFEAYNSTGSLIGQIGPVAHFDGSFSGGTSEDRFFGIVAPSGIASIRIRTTGGFGMEVDHVQYSLADCSATVQTYGSGCSLPTAATPSIGSVGLPVLGSSTFAISVSSAAPLVPLLLVCGTDAASAPFSGCDILVGGSLAFIGPTSSFTGSSSFTIGIPSNLTLIGAALYGQWFALDSTGPFLAAGSLSNGISIVVGL